MTFFVSCFAAAVSLEVDEQLSLLQTHAAVTLDDLDSKESDLVAETHNSSGCYGVVFGQGNSEYQLNIHLPAGSPAGVYTLRAVAKVSSEYDGVEMFLHSRWWTSGNHVIGTTGNGWPSDRDVWQPIEMTFDTGSAVPARLEWYVGYPQSNTAGSASITQLQLEGPNGKQFLKDGMFPHGSHMQTY
jgi:hypothetical protein